MSSVWLGGVLERHLRLALDRNRLCCVSVGVEHLLQTPHHRPRELLAVNIENKGMELTGRRRRCAGGILIRNGFVVQCEINLESQIDFSSSKSYRTCIFSAVWSLIKR